MAVRKLLAGRGFPADFDAAGKILSDFPAAQNAIPAKVWLLSGKEMAAGKSARLQERSWTFSFETTATFFSIFLV